MATAKQSSQAEQIREIISQAIANLQNQTEELNIKATVTEAWAILEKLVSNENTFRRTRKQFRDAIEQAFPCSQEPKAGYYFTRAGKGKGERYEHLALWYATVNKERWEIVGDAARESYFKKYEQTESESKKPHLEVVPDAVVEPVQEEKLTWSLDSMTIENLALDAETQQIVRDAIAQSGMSLPEFIQQACKVYANTVTGKSRKHSEDLSIVDTETLRMGKEYRTHPGRAEEIVKRAIQAIKYHNGVSTELSQKWLITQSLLVDMTGTKPTSVKAVMDKFRTDIDSYNQTLIEAGATSLLNRKGELKGDFCEEWVRHSATGID